MERKSILVVNALLTFSAAIGNCSSNTEQINGRNISPDCVHWPIDGHVTSKDGPKHPLGIDIQPDHDLHSPVHAPTTGEIIYIGDLNSNTSIIRDYGNYIVMRSADEKYEFLFAHLSEIKTTLGKRVSLDEEIALTGSTGKSTGPHVHFEVKEEGFVRLDPIDVLCKK